MRDLERRMDQDRQKAAKDAKTAEGVLVFQGATQARLVREVTDLQARLGKVEVELAKALLKLDKIKVPL